MDTDLITRLRTRAAIRRKIPRGEPDRISDILEEAANRLEEPGGPNPGYCIVSPPLLAEALHLPPDTEVVGAEWNRQFQNLVVYVKHAGFRPTPEGCPLERYDVCITQHNDAETPDRVARTYTSRWNI